MVIGAAQGGEHAYKDGHTRQTWGHTTISAYDGTVMSSYNDNELKQSLNKDHKNYALVLATLDRQAQSQGRQKMPIFDCHRLA
jgi:nitrilase